MELETVDRTKQDRGVSALIWCLSILLCALFVVCAVIGTSLFRVRQVREALMQPDRPAETVPAPTPGVDVPPAVEAEITPSPAVAPDPQPGLNLQGSDQMQIFSSIPDVVEAASKSVVGITQYRLNTRTGKQEAYGGGSGFFVSENGYILTNAHVVSGAESVDVLFRDGERKPAQVLGADVTLDVAVLKVEGENYPALPIGDSDALRVGEYVIAIGNPLSSYELYGTVTFGIISGTARQINIDGFLNTYLQTDAAINFGNSGGPLINMAGQVIGINCAKSIIAGYDASGNTISAEGIGFALPIRNVIDIANIILQEGGVVRPGIGVQIRTVDEETAAQAQVPVGCRVEEVTQGSPAEQAGIQVGDIIIKADDLTVTENDDVVNYVRSRKVSDKVAFTVYRNGEYLTIDVVIGDMNKFNQ